MNSPTTSEPDPRLARNKGLSRLTAVTLGAAAAGLVGGAGLAVAFHNSSATTNTHATSVAPGARATPNDDGLGANDSGPDSFGSGDSRPQDSSPDGSMPQFQPGVPPSNSDKPPGATSGRS